MTADQALQKALYLALKDISEFTVHDNVTDAVSLPYAVIGDSSTAVTTTSCGNGYVVTALVRLFADGSSHKPTQEMEALALEALSPSPSVEGYAVIGFTHEGTTPQAEQKGLRWQRIISIRAELWPV